MRKIWLALGVVLALTGCAGQPVNRDEPVSDTIKIKYDDTNNFEINKTTGEVTYSDGSFIIENKSWLNKLIKAYDLNVIGNNDYLYTYCTVLDKIGANDPDNVVSTKDDDDWYFDLSDTNHDGVLTNAENIDFTLDILLDDLENDKPVETVTFSYTDDIIGGTGNYDYTLKPESNEIEYKVVHMSSVVGAENIPEQGIKKVKNGIWVYNLCLLYNQKVLDSDWAYIYCRTIEDLCTKDLDENLATADATGEEYWDELYGDDDLDGDGVVTYEENISHNIQMMLDNIIL